MEKQTALSKKIMTVGSEQICLVFRSSAREIPVLHFAVSLSHWFVPSERIHNFCYEALCPLSSPVPTTAPSLFLSTGVLGFLVSFFGSSSFFLTLKQIQFPLEIYSQRIY